MRKLDHFIALSCLLLAFAVAAPGAARGGVSTILRFDAVDAAGPNGGDWYKDATNESGSIAWGESYVLHAYAVMYEATKERKYLDRLARHVDGVLATRDDRRGVADYTGRANPCWQATRYSSEPMCWAVHTGMIVYPMALLAWYVARDPALGPLAAYDGTAWADKAAAVLAAARQSFAFHDPEWRASGAAQGYYVFQPDAVFLPYEGREMPLNQMNAMGLAAAALWAATGEAAYLDKATRLANHLEANLATDAGGAYVWNYWGGSYDAPGEDISHAAISVGFAAFMAGRGVVFGADDMLKFGKTFYQNVVVSNTTSHDNVGGGPTNGAGYRPQMGRWSVLGPWDPRVVAANRNLADSWPDGDIASGSRLVGLALLARHEYFVRPFVFYVADWDDLGDRRQATRYGANVETMPHDPAVPVLFRMRYATERGLTVEQWDGDAYHGVLRLAANGGTATSVVVPFDPRWYFNYDVRGVLFQLTDSFVAGRGVILDEPEECPPPSITSGPPPMTAVPGSRYSYTPAADGMEPRLWFLEGPATAAVDRATGAVDWTADFAGASAGFALTVENDCGADRLAWSVSPLVVAEEEEEEPPETADGIAEEADDAVSDLPGETPDLPPDFPPTEPEEAELAPDGTDGAEPPPVMGSGGCACRV